MIAIHRFEDPCLIGKVRDPFGWLGNMSPHPILHEGITWPTAEALFQALRFAEDDPIRALLASTKNPMTAKDESQELLEPLSRRAPESQDLEHMVMSLALKLEQHTVIRDVLLSTGTRPIVEDVTRLRGKS